MQLTARKFLDKNPILTSTLNVVNQFNSLEIKTPDIIMCLYNILRNNFQTEFINNCIKINISEIDMYKYGFLLEFIDVEFNRIYFHLYEKAVEIKMLKTCILITEHCFI